jgi:methionyl-tRNA formyltransferase
MRIIFFGTPDYVIPVLEKLHKYHEIVAVVTQSPKPTGRDKILTYSAVDTWAHKRDIPKFFEYSELPKADMGVCASFGMIVPKVVIDKFKHGILNVHPSLLPNFRGSSPIQATLITGTNPTGVSIIKMTEKLDAGGVLTQFEEEVLEDDTNETLRARLFEKSTGFS